jgi:2-oxoglutarate dehydrogenase complex dehydrogenase (E1) component-like enzyme
MKKERITIWMAIGLVLILAAAISAQPPMPDSMRLERHLTMLKNRLNLSDTQSVQVRTILEDEQKQAAADREKYRGDFKAMQKARTERRQQTDIQIMQVLNKDQQKEFKKIQKEIRQGPPGQRPRRGSRPSAPPNG